MFADKRHYMQGYLRVRLLGYAPERFLNLCANHGIFIWNLLYREDHYEFCISVRGFRQLRPIVRKTKTRIVILERHGLPFALYRYRKRKLFFGGIAACMAALYTMSLFIWNIDVSGNLHRTDSAIIKFLEENHVYHGIRKSKLDCVALEELLRSEYGDIIWASVKIQGTRLLIDLQENLASNTARETVTGKEPSDLVAAKDAEIYSIYTRQGMPLVKKGAVVKQGDLLVEGRIPIYNDSGELVNYRNCYADADVLGITSYAYQDIFPLAYEDKVFTGEEKNSYELRLFQKRFRLPFGENAFALSDTFTTELPVRLGESFYLPLVLVKEVSKEYRMEEKIYTKKEAEALAESKWKEFCEKLEQKGVQIIENNVMIVADGKICMASGEVKVIEPVGIRQDSAVTELPADTKKEGQETNESDGNDN